MELRQLRYFVVLAEELHFRRAAQRLFISTPTLSQQIKVLERELGGPLLVREPRVELTAAGAALLRSGKNVLRAMDEAIRETRRAAADAPVLRLGLLNGVPPWLPTRIGGLLTGELPAARMVLTGGTTADQVRMLDDDEVDLALVRTPVHLPDRFAQRPVAREELGVVMSAGHPLARGMLLDPADLSGLELILFARESAAGLHDWMLRTLTDHGGRVRLSESAIGACADARGIAVAARRDRTRLRTRGRTSRPGLAPAARRTTGGHLRDRLAGSGARSGRRGADRRRHARTVGGIDRPDRFRC
ncbi:LysR family transcriptional regulator [Nocardia gipuzkoensis]|uniref:LysR family transcriptional regulator n=1 Tax=Nocardia gipuzkoensis TaxID=2749991 RepID=UPI0015EEFBD9|nr:LysR substrate-binding domain-containing protein [Nocardia gipuzkoensis]